jgi:hypothetical protein
MAPADTAKVPKRGTRTTEGKRYRDQETKRDLNGWLELNNIR